MNILAKVLAITAYAGSKKLVKMTEEMLTNFAQCALETIDEVTTIAINNKADTSIKRGLVDWHAFNETNEGFGRAINLAIQREIIEPPNTKIIDHAGKATSMGLKSDYTHVLVLNNDLQFPDHRWLLHLLSECEGNLVLSPTTDITATPDARAEGPVDEAPIRSSQVSAFCWLVPVAVIHKIRKKFGWNLFHPDFSNYGSDDVTGAVLRTLVARQPFKVVRRAWVKHLKAQTANELGVRAGDPAVLQRIKNFKRAHRLV